MAFIVGVITFHFADAIPDSFQILNFLLYCFYLDFFSHFKSKLLLNINREDFKPRKIYETSKKALNASCPQNNNAAAQRSVSAKRVVSSLQVSATLTVHVSGLLSLICIDCRDADALSALSQVPLQLIESVECRDMFQLHVTCKDCKIVR